MNFNKERLVKLRTQLGITKAEAARRLNISAMGYGRYEKGEREPSFQTVTFIAQTFGTTADYLYGMTEDPKPDALVISKQKDPDLFLLVQNCLDNDGTAQRLLSYLNKISEENR